MENKIKSNETRSNKTDESDMKKNMINKDRIQDRTAIEWYEIGSSLYNSGKYEEAIICFDIALKINPEHYPSLNGKGKALVQLGKFRESLVFFGKALEIFPELEDAKLYKKLALKELYKIYQKGSCRSVE
ncbi:MAG: tetratricopeptide repeat protein [Candidatus Hydrothermarchaeota archaeon]